MRIGRHIIVELWDCDPAQTNSPIIVEQAMRDTIAACGATLLDLRVYPFQPQGVTGAAILAESHMTVHTWPEIGFVAVDLFTCGKYLASETAVGILRAYFLPKRVQIMEMDRGIVL